MPAGGSMMEISSSFTQSCARVAAASNPCCQKGDMGAGGRWIIVAGCSPERRVRKTYAPTVTFAPTKSVPVSISICARWTGAF